ncbi:MAG: J domain-containing protein [Coriobacteriia bacterium]|nr:J domain-containing protein [Coriobacteriia bacterium]MCL2537319.1 J domain-containing protein [Coriobacteriia bacterium]
MSTIGEASGSQATSLSLHPAVHELKLHVEEKSQDLVGLVLKHDLLVNHTVPYLHAKYHIQIGTFEYELLSLFLKARQIRLFIQLVRSELNQGEIPDLQKIESIVAARMQKYIEELKELKRRLELARMFMSAVGTLTCSERETLRSIYRRLMKALHPDLNPSQTERELELFHQAIEAYKAGDLEALKLVLLVAEYEGFIDNGDGLWDVEISQIEYLEQKIVQLDTSIKRLEAKLALVESSFPINMADELGDGSHIRKVQSKFLKDIRAAQARVSELEDSKEKLICEVAIMSARRGDSSDN